MTNPNKNLFRFSFSLWLTLGMFVIFALVFAIYVDAEKQIDRANELRLQSFLLANELRQSSDDLTRMARTYVITEDSSYKQHYLEILDIRDGHRPRPIDYHNVYWDLVLANNLRPRPSRQAIPLLELMRQADFTAAEFAKLAQAKSNSDELTEVEFAAMALIEATNPTTDDNRHKAFELLFGKTYHQAKAGIMRPISEFYQMMDQRTQETVRDKAHTATLVRVVVIVFGFLLVFTLWFAYRSLYKTLGCSLNELQSRIVRVGNGDFSSVIPVAKGMENSVLDWLSETQINLARIDTERKQAAMINQYFAAIVQSSDDAIISKNLKGVVTGWNASAERIFGYTAAEMIGNTLSRLFPPDRIDEEKYILEKIADGQTINHFETLRVRKDGSLIDISVTISPIFDTAGQIIGASKIARDITERKKAEEAIAESERKYRTLFETANDGIFLQDASRFLDCNQKGADMYGLSKEEVLGKSPTDFCPKYQPDGRLSSEVAAEKIQAALRGEAPCFEWQPLRGDSTPFDVEITLNRVEYHGQPCLQAIVRDISKRKQTEAELRKYRNHLEELVKERTAELEIARDNAEAANHAKSTFIATMSHELRTPLNAILGFSELMSRDATSTTAQKETLAIINRSGAHLLSMINDVLDISKIEAGHLEIDIHAFDLIKLLQDIGDMISVRAASNQLSFRLEIAPDIAQYIKADSGKLRQVLINLLGNAIKFTKRGGVILRAHTQPLTTATMVVLSIEVIDSGVGIPADQQQDLFKPFVQLTQENADLKGTGLGLTISKSLIKLMGGDISFNSILGVGSTFKINLPVPIATANDLVISTDWLPVKSLAENQPEWRLLVVDDNPDNRLLLVTLLTEVGFQVREAENGQEAIRAFEQWQPHLILMDMRMPVLDGYQATKKIRQLAGGQNVKIVALTASVFREQHASIVNVGCDAVLHKPFQAPEIFTTLTTHLPVEFIYQEQPASVSALPLEITTEMLSSLPSELRQQLHAAALNLDAEETELIIGKICQIAPDIAASLENLIQHYQFDQIIQLIEPQNCA